MVRSETHTTEAAAKKTAARAYRPGKPRRGAPAPLAAGAPTDGGPTGRGRAAPRGAAEDGRALLVSAWEIHVERHGAHTLAPGTRLPFPEAAERAGIRPDRQRYFDALEEMEYEGAIEWDRSARFARGDKHYVLTRHGMGGPG